MTTEFDLVRDGPSRRPESKQVGVGVGVRMEKTGNLCSNWILIIQKRKRWV